MGVKKKVKICQNKFLDTTCSVQLVIVWQNQGNCGKNQGNCGKNQANKAIVAIVAIVAIKAIVTRIERLWHFSHS